MYLVSPFFCIGWFQGKRHKEDKSLQCGSSILLLCSAVFLTQRSSRTSLTCPPRHPNSGFIILTSGCGLSSLEDRREIAGLRTWRWDYAPWGFSRGMETSAGNMASFIEVNQPLLAWESTDPHAQDLREMRQWARDTAPWRKLTCSAFAISAFPCCCTTESTVLVGGWKHRFPPSSERILCWWGVGQRSGNQPGTSWSCFVKSNL